LDAAKLKEEVADFRQVSLSEATNADYKEGRKKNIGNLVSRMRSELTNITGHESRILGRKKNIGIEDEISITYQ
jgi:hypothetical protein